VAAVAGFGFTERQARFLVTVMVYSGVFLERQYCAFRPLSDESLLSDLDTIDTDELFEVVHRVYGINVPRRPQPYLWEIIAEIAAKRAR
jgi:hypothetical protein